MISSPAEARMKNVGSRSSRGLNEDIGLHLSTPVLKPDEVVIGEAVGTACRPPSESRSHTKVTTVYNVFCTLVFCTVAFALWR